MYKLRHNKPSSNSWRLTAGSGGGGGGGEEAGGERVRLLVRAALPRAQSEERRGIIIACVGPGDSLRCCTCTRCLLTYTHCTRCVENSSHNVHGV